MKIKTYQSGGIVYLPTVNRNEGVAIPGATSSSSNSGETSKVPGFAKEMISLIKENGLNSDVSVFLNQLDRLLVKASDPTGENLSMREILQAQKMANRVKQNYASYQTAEKSLESQDAWAEPATSARGWLYVMDNETKKISTVSPTDYDPTKQIALTNQDLMNYRRENPEMAFASDILDNLASSVGMKTITDYVSGIIQDFGKTNITGYSEKQSNSIKAGMDKIVSFGYGDISKLLIAGPDGVYKINQESTLVDQDLNAALNYIKSTLPNSYFNTLNAKAAAEGYDPNAMLMTMLYANTDRKIGADYDHTATEDIKVGVGGSGKKDSAMIQHTLAETYAEGENGIPPTLLEIAPADSRASLVVYGQNVGKIRKDNSGKEGSPMPIANLAQIREDAYGIANVTRDRTVVFGDQLIDQNELGGIVYDGSDMYRVVLPAKTINGGKDIVPDFELQSQLDELLENANNQGADESTINRYLQQICPGAKYNQATGKIDLPSDKKHAFLTFQGIAADNYIKFDKDSKYLVKSDFNADVYMEATKYGYANHKKNDQARIEGSADSGWFFPGRTKNHLYKGNVFIPISNPMAGSMAYNQEYIPRSSYTNITGREIEHERQMSIKDQINSGAISTNW